MELTANKKVYFASDFHFGIPSHEKSLEREKRLCRWLDSVKKDAAAIYLVGDLFDTWFEYKNVIPKGYTRFFGKLAELTDAGIYMEIFTGNHDLWMMDYFEKELNIKVNHHPIEIEMNGKKFFIGHGDGLGPGDMGYKLLKKVLRGKFSQWLYRRIHPDTGIGIAKWFSQLGSKHHMDAAVEFRGEDKEWLVQFCRTTLLTQHFHYFIFGHRHLALDYPLQPNSRYINLGDWIIFNSYAEFDGVELKLKTFSENL